MSTKEHLKMFHCLVDTGADVLRNLAEVRLLDNKKKTFPQFLEDEKHYFYHQFEHKILCCECPPHGCTVSIGKMEAHVFNKVYEFKKESITKSHIVKNGMTNQKCLHAIHTRNVILDDLDLSDLNYFLWAKGKLIPQESIAIKIIMDTRNTICHPSSTTCIGFHEINNMWTKLENAILDLSQPERYKNMVKMCIESHRARQETETEKILHGMNQIKETVKDELTKTRTDLTDESKEQTRMLRQLIGCLGSLSVLAQASPQVEADECQASGGNGQINMTATLELSSLSNEEQRQIVENFSSELKVGSDDKNILIDGKQVNSIVLDLRVSSSIFRDTETLRSALMSLVREVVDKGKIDTTVQDTIYVTLTFNSRLSWHETEILTGVLSPKMLYITHLESEGRMHNDTPEISITKDPTESIFSKKNEKMDYLENLQGLEKKAEEVTRLLLEKYVTKGKDISSLLMKHKHSIYHLYERNSCCQCSAVIPKEDGICSLRRNEFEGMFAKQNIKCKFRQKKSTRICICFWNAREDVSERCLPFPVITYLLDYSSVTNNYERQLNRMKSTLVQINKLGLRLETIDFYKIWKSLGDDILYMANAISTQYRETIDTDIQSFRPNLSTFELSVLDFMNEMNTTITDGLSKFKTEMKILRKDMEEHIFERKLPVQDVPTNASLVQGFSKDLGNQILDLKRYIYTEVQVLKADIGSLRKSQDSRELADTQKPLTMLTPVIMEKYAELQYVKKDYKAPCVSVEHHEPSSPPHKMVLNIASPHSMDKDEIVERFKTLNDDLITVKVETDV